MNDYVNTPPAIGITRQPRGLLMAGDNILDFEKITLVHSGTHEAGTMEAVVASSPGGNPGQWNWWLSQDVIVLDVYAGFPVDPRKYSSQDLTPLAKIRVDQIDLDVAENRMVIQGRDLSAIFIDNKTDGQFQNQTSSQVAQKFADGAGLKSKIQATTTKIGTYYSQDYVHVERDQTQWALLVYLAQKEGFDIYVLGDTLYFGKFANANQSSYLIQFDSANSDRPYHQSNAKSLKFEHNLTLSRDVIVTVRSHNMKTGKSFSVVAKASHGKAQAARSLTPITPTSAADAQNYVYVFHNLAPNDARQKALQLAKEISKHELVIAAELPGDDVLYPWVPIEISGTGTPFDTTFYASRIERTISPADFSISVSAKNHQTGTEVALD